MRERSKKMSTKYIVERQMVYGFYKRSPFDIVGAFDNFYDALEALEKEAYLYSNNKNVAIVISRYESDDDYQDYEYCDMDILIGFYGVDAANYLYVPIKKKKYGLVVF